MTKASHIFRRRADGTGPIENVMTGGMDNPVDVVFTAGGERLFTTTFLQNPGGGLRDGIIHAVYGGVYGKVHNVTDFHPRTGDLLPPLIHMGAAAPCGLVRVESEVFTPRDRENVFACQFNMHKVSRHELKPVGATFESTDTDFVVSDNIDFHPTDIVEDADGSLVICDTGGWYKLCCPTSQLSKPDILGAIYRVRRESKAAAEDPRGAKIRWNELKAGELAHLLDDKRPAVRQRAIHLLGRSGADAVAALKPILQVGEDGTIISDVDLADSSKGSRRRRASEKARLNAIWALTRIDIPEARALVRGSLYDPSLTVRQASLQSVSLWRDRAATPQVLHLLNICNPRNQRLSAEVLGRLEDKTAVPNLLAATGLTKGPADRVLEHGITYALIEIADPVATAAGLGSDIPAVQRAAMIALDQMPGGHVEPAHVVALLSSKEPSLKETALWLLGRHREWGDSLESHLRIELAKVKTATDRDDELIKLLARFAGTPKVQELLAGVAGATGTNANQAAQMVSLSAMQKSGLKQLPDSWIAPLTQLISGPDESLKSTAVAVLRSLPLPKAGTDGLAAALRQMAMEEMLTADRRIEAIAALPAGPAPLNDAMFSLLIGNLGEHASVATRSAAVESLNKVKLTSEQQSQLAEVIVDVGPLELNRLLAVFESATDEAVGLKLIAGLKRSPVLTSLRVDMVKPRVAKFPASVQQAAEDLYSAINVEAGRQKERLDELAGSLGQGDVRRGQLVFQTSKAACSACHAIGYLGGTIGPDLSRIGKIRTERDLLEALLFPSVSFVRSYEPVLIVTKSGKSFNGLIRRETADEITLATGAKEEARISRDDIEEIRPGTVSIMPAGLDTQLTKEQIADLLAFLKSRQ